MLLSLWMTSVLAVSEIYFLDQGHPVTVQVVQGRYYSQGKPYTRPIPEIRLRIANGGGGQTGYVGHLALAYLNDTLTQGAVAWLATNTHFSIEVLKTKQADAAILYDVEKEVELIRHHVADNGLNHVWMDRLWLMGPKANPAGLLPQDSTHMAFRKIMRTKGCYWLTRDDLSNINLRERGWLYETLTEIRKELGMAPRDETSMLGQLIAQGQVSLMNQNQAKVILAPYQQQISQDEKHPQYQTWRKMVRPDFLQRRLLMPAEATIYANQHGYYTMSDKGIFLTQTNMEKSRMFIDGLLNGEEGPYANPADCLVAMNNQVGHDFCFWLNAQRATYLASTFTGKNPHNNIPLFAGPDPRYQHHKESWTSFLTNRHQLKMTRQQHL